MQFRIRVNTSAVTAAQNFIPEHTTTHKWLENVIKMLRIPDVLHIAKLHVSFQPSNPCHVALPTVVSLCNCTCSVSTYVRYDMQSGHAEVTSNYVLAWERKYSLSVERRSCRIFSIFGINSTGAELWLWSLLFCTFGWRTSSGRLEGESVCD